MWILRAKTSLYCLWINSQLWGRAQQTRPVGAPASRCWALDFLENGLEPGSFSGCERSCGH